MVGLSLGMMTLIFNYYVQNTKDLPVYGMKKRMSILMNWLILNRAIIWDIRLERYMI